ncbi:dienelactone hydrolase family protein [Sphingobium sufflavum]|uniref:dienelactone hydrolase family protein n=1 Tax=Sphingobium sufflavum TaxID=1129547 RepID=UPI001F47629E|nr:dienelactone hydrolase family protein [Sphingobium sufflavum]MCE7795706.1 dienelactone hydrolase family protein [Sphingobium sufflavum]
MAELAAIALHHEGADLIGRIAVPAGPGPHPAVLVVHNAHGIGPAMHERAQILADAGYIALAADMYGGGIHYGAPEDAGEPFSSLVGTPGRLRARVTAWYEHLKTLPGVDPARVAAIGYCFGGMCVLELARGGADARAIISYHGILKTAAPAQPGAVKGKVAVYTGGRDPYAPLSDVDALRAEMIAAEADYAITIFGQAFHSFTDPHADEMGREGIAYDALSAKLAWAGTMTLLDAVV